MGVFFSFETNFFWVLSNNTYVQTCFFNTTASLETAAHLKAQNSLKNKQKKHGL